MQLAVSLSSPHLFDPTAASASLCHPATASVPPPYMSLASRALADAGLVAHAAKHCLSDLLRGVGRNVPCLPIVAARHGADNALRDWHKHPALLDLPLPDGDLYAVSDVHGDPERLIALLEQHDLVRVRKHHKKHTLYPGVAWCGGRSTLLVLGDVIDKGPSSLGAIDLLRDLAEEAEAVGGRVEVLMGNHEAEFLAQPKNRKACRGINRELRALGESPKHFVRDDNPRGHWLRTRPFGARVGNWFFAHGGNTAGRTFDELAAYLQRHADADGFGASAIIGRKSILQARDWYVHNAHTGARYSAALGTGHIVFGHDPSGLGRKGRIAIGQKGTLLRIDTGMSRAVDYSHGALLRVRRQKGQDTVHTCGANGKEHLLWSSDHTRAHTVS